MSARPATDPATVTVNSFNTSLPAGQALVNFTANTTNGNKVNFTISTLVPNANYTIKRDGALYNISRADSSGMIIFNNSLWPYNRTFTVEQIIEYGDSQGYIKNLNLTSLQGASVELYYKGGSPAGSSVITGADGKFQFSNLPVASYYVNATKDGFFSNRSSEFTVIANSTVNGGNVTIVNRDVNGDGEKNLLDLTEIIRRYLDLNNDGKVDAADVFMVSGYFNTII